MPLTALSLSNTCRISSPPSRSSQVNCCSTAAAAAAAAARVAAAAARGAAAAAVAVATAIIAAAAAAIRAGVVRIGFGVGVNDGYTRRGDGDCSYGGHGDAVRGAALLRLLRRESSRERGLSAPKALLQERQRSGVVERELDWNSEQEVSSANANPRKY